MKSDFILLMIYILEGIILGITAFVIRKKHSAFPDFTAGYHVKEAEKDRESWDYANETAGKLCGICAYAVLAAGIFCYVMGAGFEIMFALLLILSVAAAGSVLLVPVYLLRRTARERKTSGRVIRGVLCALIALTVLWLIWLYAYYHADSRDNLSAAGSLQGGSPELPTPEYLYSKDKGIDLFVYDKTAYVYAGDVDWVTEQEFTAGE